MVVLIVLEIKSTMKTVYKRLTLLWQKNGTLQRMGALTPKDVTAGSNKKVWWRCSKGHEWEAPIYRRNQGHGCPYCSGKKVNDENCLKTLNPALAREWHPTKNGSLTPKDVTVSSG